MMQPKISIITITYNSEKTLERTIKTIVSQNYANYEYIIVDGGSSDKTVDIIKKYENNISKWVSEPDDGISNAFNKGIDMATGDIVGIINSDDGLMPDALQKLADEYEEEIDVYRGKVLLWKEDTDTKVEEVPSMHFSYTGMANISHQSTFINRRAYERYGVFDEKCHYVMDFDLLLRFERAGAKFKYVDETLAFYTLGGITFTKVTKERLVEVEYVIKNNGGNAFDIWKYRFFKYLRLFVKKIVPKEILLKLKHKNIE